MGKITVHAAPLPFASRNVKHEFPEGKSVADIISLICKDADTKVYIDGIPVLNENYDATFPKEGQIINIRAVPRGGNGGGKSILMPVLAIGMIAAGQAWAVPALAGAASVATGTTAYIGIQIGVGLITSIAASALMSIASQTGRNRTVDNPAESTTQFIEGASNSIDPYGVVPMCLGTNRMYPPQAGRPYVETVDNLQYVRQLFTWGVGDHLVLTDLKIGETLITEFDGVELEHKLLGDLSDTTSLYANDPFETGYSVLLKQADGYTTRTAHANADEIVVDFTFTGGLCAYGQDGKRNSRTIQLQIEYSVTGVGSWTVHEVLSITGSTAEALRRSSRIILSSRGDYDVRVKRVTADTTDDLIHDEVYLTSIKTFTNVPPVNAEHVCGTAVRILATDQLNGSIEKLNAVVSSHIPDYDTDSSTWITRATSNPASCYLYVLRGPCNARPIADDKIDFDTLIGWHAWCETRGLTYNRVIDKEMSVDELLRDIAAAGTASPGVLDGKRTVVVDAPKSEIVQVVTPRNSWGYQGEMICPEIPDALRVEFRNPDKGYEVDERIVYNDGYDKNNAELYETYSIESCTDAELAWKYGRRVFAIAKLRPETHTFSMDIENLVATRGDRIKFVSDIPLIGVGDGRIKDIVLSDESAPNVESIILDDIISIPNGSTYYVRIRKADGTQIYEELITSVGDTYELVFAIPFDATNAPEIGDLCYVVETGGESDLIITKIEPQADLTAKITAQDYSPGIFMAERGVIPEFDTNITTPLTLVRPNAPILDSIQSDETVALKNADGSVTSRAVIALTNTNLSDVQVSVRVRRSGDTAFSVPNVLEKTASRVILTGLDRGYHYDIYIYYSVPGGVYSLPLQLNSYLFVGTSGLPATPTNFTLTVINTNTSVFKWDSDTAIDFSHWKMKRSVFMSGAEWNTSILFADDIKTNTLTAGFRAGTYLLKAVDLDGNESQTAAQLVTIDPEATKNVVVTVAEGPAFPGGCVDCAIVSGKIELTDPDIRIGYYYPATQINLGAIFAVYLSAYVDAGGSYTLGYPGGEDIFTMSDVYSLSDVYGIATSSWGVRVEYTLSDDLFSVSDMFEIADICSVAAMPAELEWRNFVEGVTNAQNITFRLVLESFEYGITPSISSFTLTADMEDRVEREEGLTVPVGGDSITYPCSFYAIPATSIQLHDSIEGDEIQFLTKTADGFSFKVYNNVLSTYVERTYDYISSGYGRKGA